MGLFKGVFKAGLIVGGIAAAAYAAEKLLIMQLGENPDDHPGWRPETPSGEVSTVTTGDGTTIRVLSSGQGSPIVLVHGLLVSLEAYALVWDDLVASGHRVIGLDLRGHGGTNVGEDGYGMEVLGDDIAAVVTQLDLRDAVIVGHSMGGFATLSFAARHPDVLAERVAGLVIANSAAGGLFDPPQNKAQLAAVKAGVAGALIDHEVHGTVLARLYFGPSPSLTFVRALNEMHASQPPETIVEASKALESYDLTDQLGGIEARTLVIASEKDGILPPAYAEQVAAGIDGARLEVLDDVGHMTHWEEPEEFARLVASFVDEVTA